MVGLGCGRVCSYMCVRIQTNTTWWAGKLTYLKQPLLSIVCSVGQFSLQRLSKLKIHFIIIVVSRQTVAGYKRSAVKYLWTLLGN